MKTIFWTPEGPLLRIDPNYVLMIEDLNPETKLRWALSRWEVFSIGLGLIKAVIFRPTYASR